MRILWLAGAPPLATEEVDAPDAMTLGAQALRALAREHDITLLAFAPHGAEAEALVAKMGCRRVELVVRGGRQRETAARVARLVPNDITLPEPLPVDAMRQRVADLLRGGCNGERIEAVHVASPEMLRFVPASWRGPLILDARSTTWHARARRAATAHLPGQRWRAYRDAFAERRALAEASRRANVTLVASEQERDALESAIGAPWTIHVVPPEVDCAALQPLWEHRAPEPGQVLVSGASGDLRWLLRQVYPQVRDALPATTLELLCPAPTPALRLLTALHPQARLHASRAALAGAPAVRAGIGVVLGSAQTAARLDVLQLLALGVPVVTTADLCAELGVQPEQHVLVADEAEALAASILRLTRDPARAGELILRGRQFVRDHYDQAVVARKLSAAYQHAMRSALSCELCS